MRKVSNSDNLNAPIFPAKMIRKKKSFKKLQGNFRFCPRINCRSSALFGHAGKKANIAWSNSHRRLPGGENQSCELRVEKAQRKAAIKLQEEQLRTAEDSLSIEELKLSGERALHRAALRLNNKETIGPKLTMKEQQTRRRGKCRTPTIKFSKSFGWHPKNAQAKTIQKV